MCNESPISTPKESEMNNWYSGIESWFKFVSTSGMDSHAIARIIVTSRYSFDSMLKFIGSIRNDNTWHNLHSYDSNQLAHKRLRQVHNIVEPFIALCLILLYIKIIMLKSVNHKGCRV